MALVVGFLWDVRYCACHHIPSVSRVMLLGARKTEVHWLACGIGLKKSNAL